MGSEAVAHASCVEVTSFIRGYHAYQDVWQLCVSEVLVLEKEGLNCKDGQAVAVMRSRIIGGHVSRNLSALFSYFLSRSCNKAVVEVTREKLNRSAGYGLEIPCIYRLYGPNAYFERFKKIIKDIGN